MSSLRVAGSKSKTFCVCLLYTLIDSRMSTNANNSDASPTNKVLERYHFLRKHLANIQCCMTGTTQVMVDWGCQQTRLAHTHLLRQEFEQLKRDLCPEYNHFCKEEETIAEQYENSCTNEGRMVVMQQAINAL